MRRYGTKGKRVEYLGWNDTERKPRRTNAFRNVQIAVFFLVLFLLAAISWIVPLHPTVSEAEQRDLAKFPEFSWQTLASGDYFDGINVWFADTFPFRDQYVEMNGRLKSLLSLSDTTVHGEIEQGDAIPDQPGTPSKEDPNQDVPPDEKPVDDEKPPVEEPPKHEIEEPDMTGVPVEKLGAILIAGDSAYEYYNFNQSAADTYVNTINRAAAQLEGTATVYDLIVPTSMDITLPASVRKDVNSADQRKAMDYMFSSMSDKVKKVDIYDTLRDHRDEYIYYRTDHHWTALGAYYAYTDFCKVKGTAPADLEKAYTRVDYDGFHGSFYNDSGKNAALANPDTVTAYIPKATNRIAITQKDGSPLDWHIITDVSGWNSAAKYSSFIGGDNPWSVIENPEKTDGSACILIKESFGNAFAPFLVPDYQKVYVVDYRYIAKVKSDKLKALVQQTGAKDVLFVNNISATRSASLTGALSKVVG